MTTTLDAITDTEALEIGIAALSDRIGGYALTERMVNMLGINAPPHAKRDMKKLKRLRAAMGRLQQMKSRQGVMLADDQRDR